MEPLIAVIGIGNILREDDGIGEYIIDIIEQLQLKNIETRTVHQLHLELLEDLKKFSTVIFVDASLKNEEVIFKEIETNLPIVQSSSHHLDAESFIQLSNKLYKNNTRFFICGVKGYSFEMGEHISVLAKQNAEKAIQKILSFIQSIIPSS